MARNVLFLVHGIGDHSEGWSTELQTLLSNEFSVYMRHTGKTAQLSDELEFVEIFYNDIFDSIWDQWVELSQSLSNSKIGNLPGPVTNINRLLNKAQRTDDTARDNATTGYAADAFLYYAFPLVRRMVLLRVMSTIADAVASRSGGATQPQFGILGHSLGSAVMHDAVQQLATTQWNDQRWPASKTRLINDANAFFSGQGANPVSGLQEELIEDLTSHYTGTGFGQNEFQLSAVISVANVSNLLSRHGGSPFRSLFRPDRTVDGAISTGLTQFFINIRHDLDPACLVKPFDASKLTDLTHRAVNVSLGHVYDKNVHALLHYMQNPKAHRWIFGLLCNSFDLAENTYIDRRFSEVLKMEQHPDYFPRFGGGFSDINILDELKRGDLSNLVTVLEKLI
ncbi:MAG: hypothetical protein AB8G18_19310 [Gammaproteobacteria bacterium]